MYYLIDPDHNITTASWSPHPYREGWVQYETPDFDGLPLQHLVYDHKKGEVRLRTEEDILLLSAKAQARSDVAAEGLGKEREALRQAAEGMKSKEGKAFALALLDYLGI